MDHGHLEARLRGSIATVGSLVERIDEIERTARTITETLQSGGTVYTAGNGGSAAEAMHLAEELIGRYRTDRPSLRAVCLNADSTAMTCIANDYGYEQVFARQCEALVEPRDTLIVLSTSGRSPNIVRALQTARDRGATTVGLLGGTGGACLPLCDHALVIDSSDSAHVQEAHLVIVHLWCEAQESVRVEPSQTRPLER